jgi:hypothetical protein
MNDPYPPSVSEAAKQAAGEVADAVQDNFAAVIRTNPLQAVAIAGRRLRSRRPTPQSTAYWEQARSNPPVASKTPEHSAPEWTPTAAL